MSNSLLEVRRRAGFSMLEVMIAMSVLAVGLLGVGALLAQLSGATNHSRYMGTEVMLASEKLEDLNKIAKGNLAAGGSLTADTAGYFDQIQVSSRNGGVQDAVTGTAPGAATSDMIVFDRRWAVEQDVPIGPTSGAAAGTGTQRITVIVIPKTGDIEDLAQSFQQTLVRP